MEGLTENEAPEIRIDRDGVWYYRNMEMKRSDIVQYFYRHLRRDARGNYRIELDHEQCSVQIDDAPYVIRGVSSRVCSKDGSPASITISLSDGCSEELDPKSIRMGERNVLYCRVKNKEHDARFSRQAYYQLAEYIEYDSHRSCYCLTVGDRAYRLAINRPTEKEDPYAG